MKKHPALCALIAACAHEMNRAYCASQGDDTQLAWSDAPQWQKDSALAGVEMHLNNPDATPEQSHESWLAQKAADGWVYGEVKDVDKKEHPCFLPYADLPAAQKAKDYIFRAAVHSVYAAITEAGIAPPAAVPAAAADPSLIGVTYIHRIEEWADQNYGSGLTFVKGQTRWLPVELAQKFLRHQDLFEKAPANAAAEASDESKKTVGELSEANQKAAEQREAAEKEMDMHDSVNRMGKDELALFALTNFKQTLSKREAVGALRTQVHQYIDQFGTV